MKHVVSFLLRLPHEPMKIRFAPLLFALVFALAGCKKGDTTTDVASDDNAPVEDAAPEDAAPADDADADAETGDDAGAPSLDAPSEAPTNGGLRLQLGGGTPGGFTGSQPRLLDTDY